MTELKLKRLSRLLSAFILTFVALTCVITANAEESLSGMSRCATNFYSLDLSALEYDVGQINTEISTFKRDRAPEFRDLVEDLKTSQLLQSPIYRLVLFKVLNYFNFANIGFYRKLIDPQYRYFALNPLDLRELSQMLIEQLHRLQLLIRQNPNRSKEIVLEFINAKNLLNEDLEFALHHSYHDLYWFDPYTFNEGDPDIVRRMVQSRPHTFPTLEFEDEELNFFTEGLLEFSALGKPAADLFFAIEISQVQTAYVDFILAIKNSSYINNPRAHGIAPFIMESKTFDPRYEESGYRVVDDDVRYHIQNPDGSSTRVFGTGLVFQFREGQHPIKAEDVMYPTFNGSVHPMNGDSDPENIKLEIWNINRLTQSTVAGMISNEAQQLGEIADKFSELADQQERNLTTSASLQRELASLLEKITNHDLLLRMSHSLLKNLYNGYSSHAESRYSYFVQELERIKTCLNANQIEACPEILMGRTRYQRRIVEIEGETYIEETPVDNLRPERMSALVDDINAHQEFSENYLRHITAQNIKLTQVLLIFQETIARLSQAALQIHGGNNTNPASLQDVADQMRRLQERLIAIND